MTRRAIAVVVLVVLFSGLSSAWAFVVTDPATTARNAVTAVLKSRLLGENPCDIDRLFRRIKQFGGDGRQGGGVSAVEIALWDIAGKAYGVPIYQMLGGKFREKVRVYCDTDAEKPSGTETVPQPPGSTSSALSGYAPWARRSSSPSVRNSARVPP